MRIGDCLRMAWTIVGNSSQWANDVFRFTFSQAFRDRETNDRIVGKNPVGKDSQCSTDGLHVDFLGLSQPINS